MARQSGGETITSEREQVELNAAEQDEQARLPGVGRDRARAPVEHLPGRTRDEVGEVPGRSPEVIEALQAGGAFEQPPGPRAAHCARHPVCQGSGAGVQ